MIEDIISFGVEDHTFEPMMTGFSLPVYKTEHAKSEKKSLTIHDPEISNIRLWILCI